MKLVYVGAMDPLSRELAQPVAEHLERELQVAVRRIDLPEVEFAFDAGRGQYSSSAILERLAAMCPADTLKLIGLTARDLFLPVLTFVFGHAQFAGRVAVVSLARLQQEFYGFPKDEEVLRQRTRKEALHEAGHTFGLVHCRDAACAMALSTNVRQIDRKEDSFCMPCAAIARRYPRE
jgi:archaemetzincin